MELERGSNDTPSVMTNKTGGIELGGNDTLLTNGYINVLLTDTH